jgi:lipopolysaccharide transport system ATP-binding protein
MGKTVLKVENLSKQYRLGVIGTSTLRDDLARWWAKIRRREDPTAQLGAHNQLDVIDEQYVWALQGIDFEVKQGEVLGIVGKNGAGKSTLLKLLSKVTSPTQGNIKVRGRIASLLEVGTGFHPELTGRENIYLNGAILGMHRSEIRAKFDEIVEFAGVAKYIDTPVKRYSSGMYVRLAFAVAAHLEPEILVVDEVLAVGDAEFQKKAIGKMKDVSQGQGRTVLFVSHNMGAVKGLCTRGLLLAQGKKVMEGTTNEVIDRYLQTNSDSKQREVSFEPQEDSPINFLEAKLVSNGSVSSPIDYTDTFHIELTYEVKQSLKGVNFACVVKKNGDKLMVSFDTDDHKELLEERLPGIYKYKLMFPKHVLSPGTYDIDIAVGYLGVKSLLSYPDCLIFELENTKNNIMHHSIARQPTIIAPITWQADKIK